MLNFEADAFEVLDFLLTCIHTWSQIASSPQQPEVTNKAAFDGDYNLVRAARVSCNKNDSSPCFVHQMFFLNLQENRICSCGKKSESQQMDTNLFAENIYMDSFVK